MVVRPRLKKIAFYDYEAKLNRAYDIAQQGSVLQNIQRMTEATN